MQRMLVLKVWREEKLMFAIKEFVAANLGGYLVGSVLGIVGGSLVWAWGEKAPRRARGGRRRAGAAAPTAS